jgi:uncharacterized protein YecE (DUF72 family)
MSLYLGAPMWALKAWVGSFYPAGTRPRDFLSLYSRRLNTVEGNTTFYATPSAETVERWRDETPPGFRFCLKFPRAISHDKRLHDAQLETAEFVARLEQLGDRCGPAFLQLPPTFGARGLPALAAYLDTLPGPDSGLRFAVEVRHLDYFGAPAEAALDDALRERGVARVLYDVRGLRATEPTDEATRTAQARKPDVPVRFTRTAPFAFVRYISHPLVDENGTWLDEWAGRVSAWLEAGDDAFFFCHNKNDYFSPWLARDFHARVARRQPLPPLPAWDAAGGATEEPKQPSLF